MRTHKYFPLLLLFMERYELGDMRLLSGDDGCLHKENYPRFWRLSNSVNFSPRLIILKKKVAKDKLTKIT